MGRPFGKQPVLTSVGDGSVTGLPLVSDVAGMRVLVTGASGGIGAAIAEAFGGCGASVGVHYNKSRDRAEAVVQTIEAAGSRGLALQADLTQDDGASQLIGAFADAVGGLDVLINNAGGPEWLKPVSELTDQEFDHIFDLNARSVFSMCRAAIPLLRQAADRACIINVTSLSASTGSGPGAAVYGASKAFVGAFSKTLARELAQDGIRVNMLSPGFVMSPLHDRISNPELVSGWIRQIPLGRGGEPADCAGAALFLASPKLSRFITGQVLAVNGGQAMFG